MFGLGASHASVASPMVMSIAESRIANELPNLFVFGVPHVLGQRAHVLWSYPREKTGQTCFLTGKMDLSLSTTILLAHGLLFHWEASHHTGAGIGQVDQLRCSCRMMQNVSVRGSSLGEG